MKSLFLLTTFGICLSALGQIKSEKNSKSQYNNCKKDSNLTASQRLKIFPFNIAKEIVIFSYDAPKKYSKDTIYYWGDEKPLPQNGFIIDTLQFKFDTTKIIMKHSLSKADIDGLTNILFNYSSKGLSEENGMTLPLNGIYFLGNDDKIIGYAFFCFDWSGYLKSSAKINLGNWCNIKFKQLKSYYIDKGVPVKNIK
jgi:hypothetical protein